MDVGKRIVKLRTEQGLSSNRLSKLAEVSQSYMRDIETGKSQPTIDVLSRICIALNISLSAFFAAEDSEVRTRAAHLSNGEAELPPEAEEEIRQLMEYVRHKYGKRH